MQVITQISENKTQLKKRIAASYLWSEISLSIKSKSVFNDVKTKTTLKTQSNSQTNMNPFVQTTFDKIKQPIAT